MLVGRKEEHYVNAPEYLESTGILFEINRRYLHPVGLHLEVVTDINTGELLLNDLLDCREDAEGVLMTEGEFRIGLSRYQKHLQSVRDVMNKRKKVLGFVVQGELEDQLIVENNSEQNKKFTASVDVADGEKVESIDEGEEEKDVMLDPKEMEDAVKAHAKLYPPARNCTHPKGSIINQPLSGAGRLMMCGQCGTVFKDSDTVELET